jgi:hypothetical protein
MVLVSSPSTYATAAVFVQAVANLADATTVLIAVMDQPPPGAVQAWGLVEIIDSAPAQ